MQIGNSSSGIIEAPSFKVPTVNIGDRQKGRIRAGSVTDCLPLKQDIANAIGRVLDPEFRRRMAHMKNPYERKGTVNRIKEMIKSVPLDSLLKKAFSDIAFNESVRK